MIRVMDLFSGIGGFSLGLKRAGRFQTVCYCEIEPYCQKVLLARMQDGSLDSAPICTDVRALDGRPWQESVEVICGGFPCQDLSYVGAGAGIDGERSGLWREISRLVREIRPHFLIVENVPALLGRGLGRVLGDLAESGYDAEWECLPAAAFGAPHLRDRIWIVAYPMSGRERRQPREAKAQGDAFVFANPNGKRLQGGAYKGSRGGRWPGGEEQPPGLLQTSPWLDLSQAEFHGMDDGGPDRVDRTNALGNAIVPIAAEWIGRRILEVIE